MHRVSPTVVVATLCMGLVAACGSSERAAPGGGSTSSVPATVTPVATTTPVRQLDGRPMVACTITSLSGVAATASGLCGTLTVPEDRSKPSGRTIDLRVAVIPAETDSPEPDAFVALGGGPGNAGTSFFGWLPGLFAGVHATRDIVLFDQRGTGGSNKLVLPSMPDTSGLSDQEVEVSLQTWSDEWLASIDADPRQYTTTVTADDLDAIREALGYDMIDLYGPSYGSTVAQYYIRQHGDHVRVAIMDGGTPVDVPVFENMPANSQAALELLLSRCVADAACNAALPAMPSEWSELQGALATGLETDITDPDTGQPGVATLVDIGPGLHQALLDPSTARVLPYALHLVHDGRFAEAAQAIPQTTGSGDWLAMAEIIQCSEAWARFDPAEVERLGHDSYLLDAYLGQAIGRAQRCAALPAGVIPPDDASPVVTQLPILWLAGDGDPQDPPANLASIPSQQPNARIVVMPAQQHTVGHSGCAPTVIAQFVEEGTAGSLDTACVEQAAVPGLTFTLP